jgi:hypothetical protein
MSPSKLRGIQMDLKKPKQLFGGVVVVVLKKPK